ncbi:zeta toxin family protein [Nocardia asiatica]|uniref:zeta toxin family protein n=1 Tax=Nocardia asiatica TaxID=209252 RepID=UPI0002F59AE9|nr:zeta toxin family protein [Nocardia asiatica]
MTSFDQWHLRALPTEYEADHIFRTQIEPRLLRPASPQNEPIAMVFVDQLGAGTAELATSIVKYEFDSGSCPVVLDGAVLAQAHPAYLGLAMAVGAQEAQRQVRRDTERWLSMAVEEAVRRRLNIVVISDFPTRDALDTVLTRLASTPAGAKPLRIEAGLMAAHPGETQLEGLALWQRSYEGLGSWSGIEPDPDLYEASRQHVRTVADWLDADQRIHRIGVYRRSAVTRGLGDWGLYPAGSYFSAGHYGAADPSRPTRAVIDDLSHEQWNNEYSKAYSLLYRTLATRMRPEWSGDLVQARAAARPVMDESLWRQLPDPSFDPLAIACNRQDIVVFDDFDVVTSVDLTAIKDLTSQYPHVEIAVVDDRARPQVAQVRPTDEQLDFYAARLRTSVTPATDRAEVWRNVLRVAGLSRGRASVTVIPPPEFDPAWFNDHYPARRFRVGMITNDDDSGDLLRNAHYRTILGRPIHPVETPAPRPRLADLARLYLAGNPSWLDHLAPGAAPLVSPDRLFGSSSAFHPPAADSDGLHAAAQGRHQPREAIGTEDCAGEVQPPGSQASGPGPAAGL